MQRATSMADQYNPNPDPHSDRTLQRLPRVQNDAPGQRPYGGQAYPPQPSYAGQPAYPGQPPAIDPLTGEVYRTQTVPPHARRRSRKRGGMDWAWVVVAVALVGITLVASLTLFAILRGGREAAGSGLTAAEATSVVMIPTLVQNLEIAGAAPVQPTTDPAALAIQPWNGSERFTILLMGWDRRPNDPPDEAYRTDTMILASVDPVTASIGLLSIPRDLYVTVPGYSQPQRVNSAYVLGELLQPGYGSDLTMQTVQYNLGMRIHDYLLVDFNTFITVIDAIGGVDIDNPTTINDPYYPNMFNGYDPFYLPAGHYHLDGTTALKYARTRHGSSDFDRADRQQQVILAVRDQVLNVANLPNLLAAAPPIWASVQSGIRTGLTFDQLMQLAWYIKDIPMSSIRTGVIDERYTSFYTTPRGESVLIPDRYSIGSLLVEVFGANYAQ